MSTVDDFPVGSRIETDVYSIGNRMTVVQGTVVSYWSNRSGKPVLLNVETESGHGVLSVEPSKARLA